MRIIFMGTPSFAVPSLETLLEEHDVVAVVTQPDRKSGRGKKLAYSPVKAVALEHNLPVLQPEKIGNIEILDELAKYKADLFVVVAFGQKLPQRLLEMPRLGCINVHSSLLPKYRGAAPINAVVVQGEKTTGVTTMYMGPGWDDGDIILQKEEPILPRDTAGDLHDRLMVTGALLLSETLRKIASGEAPRIAQDPKKASFAFKLSKKDGLVDFRRPCGELDRLIRGMNPWPLAYTRVKGETVKIWQASPSKKTGLPGGIISIDDQGLLVGCGRGSLLLEKMQRPNGKVISGMDFANGLRFRVGEVLE